MAQVRSVPLISMSWTACPVEVRTAMRADARRMISSANNSLQQVHLIMLHTKTSVPLYQALTPETVRFVHIFVSLTPFVSQIHYFFV